MKRIATCALIALGFISQAGAQKTYLQAGGNLANVTQDNSGNTDDAKSLYSFNAGVMTGFGLSDIIDIETGLLFTGKGQKSETNNANGDYVRTKFNPFYLELPVNLVIKFPVNKTNNLFVHAGPYAAVGIAGKSKFESKLGPLVSERESDIQFNNDDPTTAQQEDASFAKVKRFDYGLNFGGGIALSKIILKANYGLGLAKIGSTETNNNENQKNKYRTISLSLGFPL